MQAFKNKKIYLALIVFTTMIACQQYETIYEVDSGELQSESVGKTKVKSIDQYISILYANLFKSALPSSKLGEIKNIIAAIGDKSLAKEVIISNFMNNPAVQIPSDTEMRNDPNAFVIETFERFYVRRPSASEKAYFVNLIDTRSKLSVEIIFTSFALSDEYNYY